MVMWNDDVFLLLEGLVFLSLHIGVCFLDVGCKNSVLGIEYIGGTPTQTWSGIYCYKIVGVNVDGLPLLGEVPCTNPDGDMDIPGCEAGTYDFTPDYCDVPYCDGEYISTLRMMTPITLSKPNPNP